VNHGGVPVGETRPRGHESRTDGAEQTTARRTTLTTTGGAVVAVLDRTGRVLTLDDQNDLVLHDPVDVAELSLAISLR